MKTLKLDLNDKLINGILTPLLLNLLAFFLLLLTPVVEVLAGDPGLLIYAILLVALTSIFMERSIAEKFSDAIQARFGMAGGLVGWILIETSIKIDLARISSETGIIIYLLVFLIVFIFWRKLLPIGAKFFFAVFISCWSGHIFLGAINFLSVGNPYDALIKQIIAFTAIGTAVISLIWILLRSKTPLQRLWGAIVLGLSLATLAYALRVYLPTFYL